MWKKQNVLPCFCIEKDPSAKAPNSENGLSQHVQKRYGIGKSTKEGLKKHKSGCLITLQIVAYSGTEIEV